MTHLPPFHADAAFNAHHSPMGAYLTFTCGHFNTRGGLAAQLGKPATQDLFIGIKDAPRHTPAPLKVLPFFDGSDQATPQSNFTPEAGAATPASTGLVAYPKDQIIRRYGHASDEFQTPDFTFRLFTPFGPIPDPATASPEEMRNALLPAITAELDIDNTSGHITKTAFFAINFQDGGCRLLERLAPNQRGFAFRANLGFSAELASDTTDLPLHPLLRWSVEEALIDINPVHLLGQCPGIALEVPPGRRATLRLALACHLPDIVTTRLEARYLYARYYPNLEAVLTTALARFDELKHQSQTLDQKLLRSKLSPDQQFLIAHSTRSYYANTQLLDLALTNDQPAQPYWIVNEGEYCMMNTLDLAADHVFWELDQNPWLVKKFLNHFLKHYSYTDEVKTPQHSVLSTQHSTSPGGLSFTHDQGTHNQFSPFGTSAYELPNLTGCFSYMTQEQLCNWILIAASYLAKTSDVAWANCHFATFRACLDSMKARAPVGAMAFDSARCGTGSEITTYDSLDASLGQARQNLYLTMKCWAAYEGLGLLFELLHHAEELLPHLEAFHEASECAVNTARVVANLPLIDHALPAVFERESPGHSTRILPAIEGLLFPYYWNSIRDKQFFPDDLNHLPERFLNSSYATGHAVPAMITALRTHTQTLLADPARRNHFPDGGIRLSSTSDNSWLSKIALVQHVARSLFRLDENGNETQSSALGPQHSVQSWPRADAAHVQWLTTGPGAYWCACDQIVNATARGSKYYPRLITTTLWLKE